MRPEIPSCSTSKKNAFTLLMSSAKTMKLPDKISSDDKLMSPQRLYNDVIDVLEEGVKWVASCIQSGERTVKVLRVSKSKGSFIGSVNTISFNSHNQCSNMYIIIIYGKRRKRKFHQSRRNLGKKTEWGTRRQIPTKNNIT